MNFELANGVLSTRPKILVVDDQPTNIQTLFQIFSADHQVFMATNGPDALRVCELQQPDIVIQIGRAHV